MPPFAAVLPVQRYRVDTAVYFGDHAQEFLAVAFAVLRLELGGGQAFRKIADLGQELLFADRA